MGTEVVQKDVVAKFVHDAVEIEESIYTLHRMEQESLSKKDYMLQEAETILNDATQKHENEKIVLEKCKANYQKTKNQTASAKFRWSVFFLSLIATGYISFIIMTLLSNFSFFQNYAIAWTMILSMTFGGAWLLEKWDMNTRQKTLDAQSNEFIANAEHSIKNAEAACRSSLDLLNEAKIKNRELIEQSNLLEEQILIIKDHRTIMANQLEQLYAYGIIPPDYRTYDCMTILDQIFRNDLADTMRDAIKIYEERVFKGTVIRGMDRICSAIGNLSHGMEAMATRLEAINTKVAQMSNDLYYYNQDIIKELKKSSQASEDLLKETELGRYTNEKLLKETQLGRYTNEKLLESSKTLEYYAEEYRLGRMPRDYMNQ